MRECAPFIHSSLTYLFNLSISTNKFPTEFKQAIVTPLFKNRGSSNNLSNYRPVSLLSTIVKVLDDIQSARLLKYFLQEKLISTYRFGFLPLINISINCTSTFVHYGKVPERQGWRQTCLRYFFGLSKSI